MSSQTRFLFLIIQALTVWKAKVLVFKTTFSVALFTLLLGFIVGNLFTTFLGRLRSTFCEPWDGFIILFVLFTLEFISFLIYSCEARLSVTNQSFAKQSNNSKRRTTGFVFPKRSTFSLYETQDNLKKNNSIDSQLFYTTTRKPRIPSNFAQKGVLFCAKLEDDLFLSKPRVYRSNSTKTKKPDLSFEVTLLSKTFFYKSLNYFKIGLMLGLFIDAFKVGS